MWAGSDTSEGKVANMDNDNDDSLKIDKEWNTRS